MNHPEINSLNFREKLLANPNIISSDLAKYFKFATLENLKHFEKSLVTLERIFLEKDAQGLVTDVLMPQKIAADKQLEKKDKDDSSSNENKSKGNGLGSKNTQKTQESNKKLIKPANSLRSLRKKRIISK
jgi:hypothetical protein